LIIPQNILLSIEHTIFGKLCQLFINVRECLMYKACYKRGSQLLKQIYVGIDGGATKCTVRLEDDAGVFLCQATGGPANIRISVSDAWASIKQTINAAIAQLDVPVDSLVLHAGMGLAGCEIADAKQEFLAYPHGLQRVVVTSDAHTACLGAHAGRNGVVIIVGTGTVGLRCEDGVISAKVGGWGFPHDDVGGGAWLGLEAAKLTLQSLDGRLPMSALAKAVYTHFDSDHDAFVNWANIANSTRFAELAPFVIAECKNNDPMATNLLERAAREIERLAQAICIKDLPCALVGGVAPFIEPYLSANMRKQLQPCKGTPAEGAIMLLRKVHG
jgi:glucosamine kinase